jgi:RNA polymerase sigma-70 factor (ECF subfamily)
MSPEAVGEWMQVLRPRLHNYCARMVGSAFDGEDVVQEALAKASQALGEGAKVEHPEPWLFRIAHNASLDALRRRHREARFEDDSALEDIAGPATADSRVGVTAALSAFLALVPAQRASVALIDVIGHSLEETATILDTSVAAVKAALHRGRARLRDNAGAPEKRAELKPEDRARLSAYAERFNAHDWDALRALLAEDVRLDLANRVRIDGRRDVSVYFTRYESKADWHFKAGMAEGRPALLVNNPADPLAPPTYVVLLDWAGGKIARIRDYRFAPYVAESLAFAGVDGAKTL